MLLSNIQLKKLFYQWHVVLKSQKQKLTDLDSLVGDGDLGLTMDDGFSAVWKMVENSEEQDVGKLFYLAGKTLSRTVPSTMGTLMACGFMQAGKAFKDHSTLTCQDFTIFFKAFFDGVQQCGKAQPGEKTFLDGLYPAVLLLNNSVINENNWQHLAHEALQQAEYGVQQTTTMLAKHGRAAIHGEASRALVDAGAYVAMLLLQGYCQFVDRYYHDQVSH